jgi:hypothetical protein|tara:strand:- start:982 stop:1608 length:627 start_codon:yes stop_codon:yes gene_type:complete
MQNRIILLLLIYFLFVFSCAPVPITPTEHSGPMPKITGECVSGDCDNGQGTYIWSDGERYKGEWKYGKFSGKGIFIYRDGHKYVGHWEDGKKHGKGTMINSGGKKIFYGTYKTNDPFTGKADWSYKSGATYKGDVENGKANGLGSWTNNNYHYNGEYKDDRRSGWGIATYEDGSNHIGLFYNGRFVEEKPFSVVVKYLKKKYGYFNYK